MFSKPKTITEENKIEEKTFLQRMVAPVKNALSFFKGLISSERESNVPTLSTPNKFIISKKYQIGNSYEGSSHKGIKIINLRQELDKNIARNSLESGHEWKLEGNSNSSRLTQDINKAIYQRQQKEKSLLINHDITAEEVSILNKKNLKLSEKFFFGKSSQEPDDKRDRIREVVSSVNYTIKNKTNYTIDKISLAKRIIEQENFKKLKKNQESLNPLKIQEPLSSYETHCLNKFLNTNIDVEKLIYNMPSNNNNNINNVRNNLNNLSQNHSQTSSNISNSNIGNITKIKTSDRVCQDPAKRLFNLNTKKRKFDEHERSCNLENSREEKLCDLVMNAKCGDCLKLKYENNKLKIKLRDSIIQKRKGGLKITSNEDETPSTIRGTNQSHIMSTGSLSFSHSKDSVNNSFVSEKGLNKTTAKQEPKSFINTEINYINQANLKRNPSTIPEDFDEDNLTASKKISIPTPQFRSMHNNNRELNNREKDSNKLQNQSDFSDKNNSVVKEINKNPDNKINSKLLDRNINTVNREMKENSEISSINKSENLVVGLTSDESDLKIQKEPQFPRDEINSKILKNDKFSFFNFKEKKQIECIEQKITICNKDKLDILSEIKQSDDNSKHTLEPIKRDLDKTFKFINNSSSVIKESNLVTDILEVKESNNNINIISMTNNQIKEKEIKDENSLINKNTESINEIYKSQIEQSASEGIPKDPGDNIDKKDENQTKEISSILVNENNLLNNPVSNLSFIKNNDIPLNIPSTNPPVDEMETKKYIEAFTEKPKGSFANTFSTNKQNEFKIQLNQIRNTETVAKNNSEVSEINMNNSNDASISLSSKEITSNTGTSNLLTDNISNPFIQMNKNTVGRNSTILDKQSKFSQDPFSKYASTGISGISNNNNITPNIIIPQSQGNPHNSINNIQISSPASSVTSNMTFGNKNINDTSTNYGTGNILNTNSFFGTNFSTNIPNNLRQNLSIVAEDEGRMSVDNETAYEGMNNTNFNAISNNNIGGNNLQIRNNLSFPNSFNTQITNPIINRNDQGNLNNNFTTLTQNPNNYNNSFSHNSNRFSNMINSQFNIGNAPSMNQIPFPNQTNAFSRNNNQSENLSNTLKSNPFLSMNSNDNTDNSNSGGLGLFHEHLPKQRRNYRK